jgi:hypothetical protein
MRRLPVLALALATVALTTGCGSSSTSSSSSSSTPPATSSTASTATTSSTPGSTSTSSSAGGATSKTSRSAEIAQFIVRACKTRIQNEPGLTTPEKAQIETLCAKAAQGRAAAREVAEQVCTEIIKRSAAPGSPTTPAREQALAACKRAK